jgi:hypothetical protein
MKLEVLTVAKISVLTFWVVTLCGLEDRYQCFGGTYCLVCQIHCYLPPSLHGITTQKININKANEVSKKQNYEVCTSKCVYYV